jgi:hypothetical protein
LTWKIQDAQQLDSLKIYKIVVTLTWKFHDAQQLDFLENLQNDTFKEMYLVDEKKMKD